MSSIIDNKVVSGYKIPHRRYDKSFILEIVESIENGVVRSSITKEHGIAKSVLACWMRDYGSPGYHASKKGHLSLQQKKSIVRAIQEGRMTIFEAKVACRVNSTVTITKWLKDSKRENEELVASNKNLMANKVDNLQPDPDPGKMTLEQALKELEEEKLKVKALNTLIDIAEENLKISIRKKAGAKQSEE
jgi:transposase